MSNKVIVVEDNDFVRMQIVKFLQEADFDCIEFSRGDEALEAVNDDIAAAVVDVRMEPIDGFEFVSALRAQDLETPVVLVTGDENPDLLSETGRLGISAVLMKPVQKDRLVKMITRVTRKGS